MREQKKDRTPAKGNGLIGNRLHGNFNLANLSTVNKANERRILAEMIPTLKSGYNSFLKVYRALEAKYHSNSITNGKEKIIFPNIQKEGK